MKNKFTYVYSTNIVFLFLVILCLGGCRQSETVRLCDYKNFVVNEEIYKVSDEDLNFAIEIKLIEKEVLLPKQINRFIEEFDIVDLNVDCEGTKKDYRLTIGDDALGEDFDKQLLGLEASKSYIIESSGTTYTIAINEIYTYAEKITDDIAKRYFDCESAKLFTADTKAEIENHRKFEYAYEKLISESMIKTEYSTKTEYIDNIFEYLQNEANESGITLEEYTENELECSPNEYRGDLENFFDEYEILKAFAEAEKITITDEEFETYLNDIINDTDMEKDKFLNFYGEEYVYYSIYYDKAFDKLLKYL